MELGEFVQKEVKPYIEKIKTYDEGLRSKLLPYVEFIFDSSLGNRVNFGEPLKSDEIEIFVPADIVNGFRASAYKIYDETFPLANKAAEYIVTCKAPALSYVTILGIILELFGKDLTEFRTELSQHPMLWEICQFELQFGSMRNVPGLKKLKIKYY